MQEYDISVCHYIPDKYTTYLKPSIEISTVVSETFYKSELPVQNPIILTILIPSQANTYVAVYCRVKQMSQYYVDMTLFPSCLYLVTNSRIFGSLGLADGSHTTGTRDKNVY